MIQSMLFPFMGGLGLFLYGMKIMSEGLQKAAGDRLRKVLEKLTTNRFMAFMVGVGVTAVVQSSSATTVMVVGFVNAGLMNLLQAIGVILGANIGTTVTAQMIAFKVQHYALPAIGLGVGLKFFASSRRWQYYGEILIGFGMLFYGLTIMKGGLTELKHHPVFEQAFITFGHTPLLAVLAGALLTMVLQSSSATVGITMALAVSGALTFKGGVALILGENIGTTITALLASIGTNVTAKRAARAHMIFNVLGVCYMLVLFPLFLRLVNYLTPGDPDLVIRTADQALRYGMAIGEKPLISRHLANAHTIFNVVNCLIFLPLLGVLAKVSTMMVPSHDEEEHEYHLRYLDNRVLDTPSLALSQARQETVRMVEIARKMLRQTMECFRQYSPALVEKVYRKENTLDMLQKEITDFLVAMSPQSLTREFSQEVTSIMYMVNNLERIGDHSENLIKLVERRRDGKVIFSDQAVEEIEVLAQKTMEFLDLATAGIAKGDKTIMAEAKRLEGMINSLEDRYRNGHIIRLNEGSCSVDAGLIFIDILTNFEKIGDHCYNLAESVAGLK
ncbi:MAG: Na/Pi cotransporter family protein [Deltaproteobacteria bacterium]|nr:Na/Pi cotransporter family protein [Candidatus Anaeroferrophillus wilburensis]MBN2889343.1 Na/Pi cotransporter family protein [Deltaproteobacteria bacterium]